MPARASANKPRWNVAVNPAAILLLAAVALTILGLTILFSASASYQQGPYFYLKKQLVWVGLSAVTGFVVSRLDLESARRYIWLLAGACLVALVLVRVPHIGVMVKGSRRWLGYGPLRLQVSEFAKIVMVFSLAHYLAINQSKLAEFKRGFLAPAAWVGLFAGLVIIEPDFGTAFLIGTVGMILIYLAGARLRYLVPAFTGACLLFAVAILHDPVRLRRITSFLNVQEYRSEGAYQLWQAILAFAAGGVNGVGLGNGRQQLNFLPEAHTDFIFAVVGEELGLFFTIGVVVLFVIIFVAGLWHLRKAPNLFQYLLVAGCLLLICLQAIINLGVVTGSLPTKGMSLPFISAGGSNLLLMGILIGVILNTQRTWPRPAVLSKERAMKEVLV